MTKSEPKGRWVRVDPFPDQLNRPRDYSVRHYPTGLSPDADPRDEATAYRGNAIMLYNCVVMLQDAPRRRRNRTSGWRAVAEGCSMIGCLVLSAQAAELALNALLVARSRTAPSIHDLSDLYDLLDESAKQAVQAATPNFLADGGKTVENVLREHANSLMEAHYLTTSPAFPPWIELAEVVRGLLHAVDNLRDDPGSP